MSKYEMPNFQGVVKGSKEYNEVISARTKMRNDATQEVVNWIQSNKDKVPVEVSDASLCLIKQSGGFKSNGNSKASQVSKLFVKKNDELSEDDIFAEFKYGRTEMRNMIKTLIQKENKWISFDPTTGVYKLESLDINPPKNWKGYIPKAKVVETEEFESVEV